MDLPLVQFYRVLSDHTGEDSIVREVGHQIEQQYVDPRIISQAIDCGEDTFVLHSNCFFVDVQSVVTADQKQSCGIPSMIPSTLCLMM
jgi:hypothetical protein